MNAIIETIVILNTARQLASEDGQDWFTFTQAERDLYIKKVYEKYYNKDVAND